MCGPDSASALGYFLSTEAEATTALIPTVAQWAWLMGSKWLFVKKKMNECVIINWVSGAEQRYERSCPSGGCLLARPCNIIRARVGGGLMPSTQSFLQLCLSSKMELQLHWQRENETQYLQFIVAQKDTWKEVLCCFFFLSLSSRVRASLKCHPMRHVTESLQ